MGIVNSKSKFNDHEKTLVRIRAQMAAIDKYKRNLESGISQYRENAISLYRQGKKNEALRYLKLKKYHESILDKTYTNYEKLEKLFATMEFSQLQKDFIETLKKGTEALEDLQKDMSIESVKKLMEETEESLLYQREIDEKISSILSSADNYAIDKEFQELKESMNQNDPASNNSNEDNKNILKEEMNKDIKDQVSNTNNNNLDNNLDSDNNIIFSEKNGIREFNDKFIGNKSDDKSNVIQKDFIKILDPTKDKDSEIDFPAIPSHNVGIDKYSKKKSVVEILENA